MKEVILCAAIWYKEQPTAYIRPVNVDKGVVVCGHRHPHCISTFIALTGKRSVLTECGEYVQGFITSSNRFLNRAEAARLVVLTEQCTPQNPNMLFSEDLY